jgi:two-component system chemotaxis response regulator CheY
MRILIYIKINNFDVGHNNKPITSIFIIISCIILRIEKLLLERCMASVLAVDDSASMRQMVAFTLKGAGYTVVEAIDGVDALNKAKMQKFDCVLTDVNMPNMDGITLIKELRALPNYKFVPMLMLTTESGMDKKQQGKAAGATGWIVKPFNPDQLLKTIKKVLG